jgi:hypothetical protein
MPRAPTSTAMGKSHVALEGRVGRSGHDEFGFDERLSRGSSDRRVMPGRATV